MGVAQEEDRRKEHKADEGQAAGAEDHGFDFFCEFRQSIAGTAGHGIQIIIDLELAIDKVFDQEGDCGTQGQYEADDTIDCFVFTQCGQKIQQTAVEQAEQSHDKGSPGDSERPVNGGFKDQFVVDQKQREKRQQWVDLNMRNQCGYFLFQNNSPIFDKK